MAIKKKKRRRRKRRALCRFTHQQSRPLEQEPGVRPEGLNTYWDAKSRSTQQARDWPMTSCRNLHHFSLTCKFSNARLKRYKNRTWYLVRVRVRKRGLARGFSLRRCQCCRHTRPQRLQQIKQRLRAQTLLSGLTAVHLLSVLRAES